MYFSIVIRLNILRYWIWGFLPHSRAPRSEELAEAMALGERTARHEFQPGDFEAAFDIAFDDGSPGLVRSIKGHAYAMVLGEFLGVPKLKKYAPWKLRLAMTMAKATTIVRLGGLDEAPDSAS